MAVVTVSKARAGLRHLIERALAGEEVLIARRGKAVARLAPCDEAPARRPLGQLAGSMTLPHDSAFFDPLPDDFLDAYYNGPIFPEQDGPDGEQR